MIPRYFNHRQESYIHVIEGRVNFIDVNVHGFPCSAPWWYRKLRLQKILCTVYGIDPFANNAIVFLPVVCGTSPKNKAALLGQPRIHKKNRSGLLLNKESSYFSARESSAMDIDIITSCI